MRGRFSFRNISFVIMLNSLQMKVFGAAYFKLFFDRSRDEYMSLYIDLE
jgi:hypothetical protein